MNCPRCGFNYLLPLQIKGGKARAKSLTPQRRTEIARAAGKASGVARIKPKT